AISLSTLYSLHGTGVRAVTAVDDHMRARLLAQSLMAEMSYDRSMRPGVIQGRFDKFSWTLSITPVEQLDVTRQGETWALYQLQLAVFWSHGRRIELQTLRLLRTK